MEPTETAAKLAIAEQLANYARAMDRIDHDLGYAVWHPEGTARYGTMFEGTGRAFIDWVCATHTQMIAHMHRVTNILIVVDGD
ncbi:MAG: nuclear transport factor 2 family protein, partial [Pseudomonadota bacterium]